MKKTKEIKDIFNFEMSDAIYEAAKKSTVGLTTAYEPLKQFSADDIKAAYTANEEDLLFVDAVIERVEAIQAKKILISDEILTGLLRKRRFVGQNKFTSTALRKLADKLDAADTIALSESYNFAATIHEAVDNAVSQKVEGAELINNEIQETKLRAIRAAETRKKNELAKKKAEKAALEAAKLETKAK